MKKSFRKILSNILSLAIVISLLPGIFGGWLQIAQATVYVAGSMSDTMTNGRDNTTADHSIKWTLPSGVTFDVSGTTDYMRVDFPADFTNGGTWATGDFTMAVDDGGRTLSVNAVAEGTGTIDCTVAAGADNVCIAIDTTNKIFTIKPSATFTATTADQYMILTIDGTTTDGTLTNPNVAADTSYTIALAMCDEAADCSTWGTQSHTGSLAVDIEVNTTDQVVVSATVDPSISLTLSTNAVNLGTLTTGGVSSQTMTSRTVTNAVGGYSTTLLENNNLRIDVTHDIDDVAVAGTIDAGTEEYGISTNDTTDGPFDIIYDADCAAVFNADPITSTAQTFAGDPTGPSDETTTLCFAASIDGTTTAGSYTHTLTFVSTGTF